MKKHIDKIFIVIILLLCIPIILPYFHSGYFPTHDGEWAVVRLSEMFRELKDHQFPPRISGILNFEYGYPLFNFAYPFPYYLGILLHFLRINFVSSIKILFAISVPISGIGMFYASKKLWNNVWAGLVSSILYLYLPYRFVDLYVRGSLGESLSFALFPVLFYGVIQIYREEKKRIYVVLTSLTYAALIMTHNIMAVLFSIVLFVLILAISYVKRSLTFRLLFTFIMGALLSAFFAIPALFEKKFILLSKIPIADRSLYFVKLDQLIIPSWGYGVPTDLRGAFSYQIGWPHVVLFALLIVTILISAKIMPKVRKEFNFRLGVALTILTLILLCLLFSPSLILWKNTPLLSEINYPWTLLAPIGFLISLLCGYMATFEKQRRYLAVSLAICSILFFLPYAKPQQYVDRGETFYSTNEATTTSSSELMPLWVKKLPQEAPHTKVVINGGLVSNLFVKSNRISFTAETPNPTVVTINTIYYPGWNAFISNAKVPIMYNNMYGVMEVKVPAGMSQVALELNETPLRMSADVITILSAVILAIYFFFARRLKLSL